MVLLESGNRYGNLCSALTLTSMIWLSMSQWGTIRIGIMLPLSECLDALTYLILLRCGGVVFPPLFSRWAKVFTGDMMDLHQFLSDCCGQHVPSVVVTAYDWHSLLAGQLLVKSMWFQYVRRHIPLPTAVLSAGELLQKRREMPREVGYGSELLPSWEEQCHAALQSLHGSENSSYVQFLGIARKF